MDKVFVILMRCGCSTYKGDIAEVDIFEDFCDTKNP